MKPITMLQTIPSVLKSLRKGNCEYKTRLGSITTDHLKDKTKKKKKTTTSSKGNDLMKRKSAKFQENNASMNGAVKGNWSSN